MACNIIQAIVWGNLKAAHCSPKSPVCEFVCVSACFVSAGSPSVSVIAGKWVSMRTAIWMDGFLFLCSNSFLHFLAYE